jgi:hypothetical protein
VQDARPAPTVATAGRATQRHDGPLAAASELHSGALMIDLVYLLTTVAFFGLSIAYVAGCDKL